MMNLLKPQRSHVDDKLDKPVYFLWSRDGNLDNQPNAWYTPNHIATVICVPDAQHEDAIKMPSTKSTGAKQSTLLTFLKPPSVKPGAKRKVDHPAVLQKKTVKKSEEKVGLDNRSHPKETLHKPKVSTSVAGTV